MPLGGIELRILQSMGTGKFVAETKELDSPKDQPSPPSNLAPSLV